MSAAASALKDTGPFRFWQSTLGKKAVMAVSGVILFAFVVGHLLGNLQIYEGPEKINSYARFLRSMPSLLWSVRGILLLMVVLHIWASVQLALSEREARPAAYQRRQPIASTYASRTMYWSGPIILAFIVYHLLEFTFGVGGTPYQEGNVYANVIAGFRVPVVSGFYIVAMLLLGLHLSHGLWSMFQSLGFAHPRYTPAIRKIAKLAAWLIVVGNISIPVAVLAGFLS
ncbi:MAG: succinate dehydrogenase cytochrome b subunit [Bryobacteraceae bacterium]